MGWAFADVNKSRLTPKTIFLDVVWQALSQVDADFGPEARNGI